MSIYSVQISRVLFTIIIILYGCTSSHKTMTFTPWSKSKIDSLAKSNVNKSAEIVTYRIRGIVSCKQTHDVLLGANVVIDPGNNVGYTDIEGNYVITNLKPGIYNITAHCYGYISCTDSNINIMTYKDSLLNYELVDTVDHSRKESEGIIRY